jgi:hypothetical protein
LEVGRHTTGRRQRSNAPTSGAPVAERAALLVLLSAAAALAQTADVPAPALRVDPPLDRANAADLAATVPSPDDPTPAPPEPAKLREYKCKHLSHVRIQTTALVGGVGVPLYMPYTFTTEAWGVYDGGGTRYPTADFARLTGDKVTSTALGAETRRARNKALILVPVGAVVMVAGLTFALAGCPDALQTTALVIASVGGTPPVVFGAIVPSMANELSPSELAIGGRPAPRPAVPRSRRAGGGQRLDIPGSEDRSTSHRRPDPPRRRGTHWCRCLVLRPPRILRGLPAGRSVGSGGAAMVPWRNQHILQGGFQLPRTTG